MVMEFDDVFDLPPNPSSEALRRWRRATIFLNAARRFRYTADLNSIESKGGELSRSRFRRGANAVLALNRFIEAGKLYRRSQLISPDDTLHSSSTYDISCDSLCDLNQSANVKELLALGGVSGVAKGLNVDLDKGISGDSEDLESRKESFGSNTYPEKPQKSFWVFLYEASQDKTLIILMGCAVLSFIAGMATENPSEGWYEGAAIAFAIFLVILVTATSDYRQSLQFRSLDAEKSNIQIQVIRNGRRQPLSIFELVVGDVVSLAIGDQVPADGLFVCGHSLTIDESSMTGESHPRHKNAKHPFLLSGCKVSDGFGNMLVTGVGLNTEWGRVMGTLSDDQLIETPLQVRLNGLATTIGKCGLTVAFLVLIILLIRFGVNYEKMKALNVVKRLVHEISIAVTIVVVAVPEGLPLAVTITLAYSMRKMMMDKALVRKLSACETMGSSTTICSDKTGTLTMNQMTVLQTWVAGAFEKEASKEIWNIVFEGVVQNSSGSVFIPPNGGDPEVSASPTEAAILTWCLNMGMDYVQTKMSSTILAVESFNSEKKRAGVLLSLNDGKKRVHWKGAAEILLKNCSHWTDSNNNIHSMSPEKKEELEGVIHSMASFALRCIALCYKTYDDSCSDELKQEDRSVPLTSALSRLNSFSNSETQKISLPDAGLTLIGIIGLKDPCRPNVPEAVASCQRAGVKVRMITGDNIITAKAIALECGILTPDGVIIEGKDFRVLSEDQLRQIIPRIDVMARSSPTDKHLMVKMLRSMDEVVAVTGDGTNDAPALHEADIGLAMGISGTEVAKESSDIVILDDNFASIVKVMKWGRSVYANIQKFIQFQLTVNISALTINFVAAIHQGDVPLTTVQLLWVNLIMDTLGALALATEPPTDRLLDQKPVGRKAPLITNIMWRNLLSQTGYQLIVLLTLHFKGTSILNLPGDENSSDKGNAVNDRNDGTVLNTIIFNSFVFTQIFNEINSRKPDRIDVLSDILKNKMFCFILIISVGFQIIIVEFLQNFASTTGLSLKQWGICVAIGFFSLPLAALVKLIPVPEKPFREYFAWKAIY